MAKPARPVIDRLMEKVSIDPESGCWIFMGSRNQSGDNRELGYGMISVGSRTDGTRRNRPAHLVTYEHMRGQVPDGLELDHIVCSNRPCCNPWHVTPVTHRANMLRGQGAAFQNARKTHCVNGHEFTPETTHVNKRDWRICVICNPRYKPGRPLFMSR